MQTTIDFAIVGAARSGTTSLHAYLSRHPDLFLPAAKELAYFIAEPEDPTQARLIATYYHDVAAGQMVGLSEANMLLFARVPARLRTHNPRARVIAVLRNPVERAYSGYWFARLRGWEPSATFEAAIERELRGGFETDYDRINFTHLEHGHYADQLARYVDALGRDRVHVLLTEDLKDRPEATLASLLAELGVASQPLSGIDVRRRHNVTSRQRIPGVGRLIWRASRPLRRAAGLLPQGGRAWLRRRVLQPLRRLNRVAATPPPMRPATRALLHRHFAPHNERLAELLRRDLSHWR